MKHQCLSGWVALCLIVFFSLSLSMAEDAELPRITVDQLKSLMDSGEEILVVDCQPLKRYKKAHIKGAVSLPWAPEIDKAKARKFPRKRLIVTYCDCGPGEEDSNNVGIQLRQLGYNRVKVLAHPSIGGWMKKGYPVEK